MADPFSITGVAFGAASLIFQIRDECIKCYQYFSEAIQMPERHHYLQLRMQMEQQRFLGFVAEATPFFENGQTCATLQVSHELLAVVLAEIRTVFAKFEKNDVKYGDIMQKHRGDWDDRNEPQIDVTHMLRLACQEQAFKNRQYVTPYKGFRKVGQSIKKTARKLLTLIEEPRRLVWASIDREAFEALISKLSNLNTFLITLLDGSQMKRLVRAVEMKNLEILQLREDVKDLDVLVQALTQEIRQQPTYYEQLLAGKNRGLLEAAKREMYIDEAKRRHLRRLAKLKICRIETDYADEEIMPPGEKESDAMVLDPSIFTYAPINSDKDRHGRRIIASWNNHSIWIEWMSLSSYERRAHMTETLRENRVFLLTKLLRCDVPSGFRTPRCLGYTKSSRGDSEPSSFGLVFEIPPKAGPEISLLTLRQLLERLPRPPLSARLLLASTLADSVSSFHSVGWLHKGLRSDNILFFGGETRDLDLSSPYVSGFELSRPSDMTEVTEKPIHDPGSDIYRHPHAQFGEVSNSYRRSYDLYSFGVILMEIALWKPIETIIEVEDLAAIKQHELRDVHKRLLGRSTGTGRTGREESDCLGKAANECGDVYRDIIELCLEANNVERPTYRGEPRAAINARVQMMFEDQVTGKLRLMKEALSC
ncbi:hypothetical protein DL770_010578 [Monosporascus sp. CRB-9-2]|nr:hypothetical protein DL770_010578 [Monosporascus sp. CRB-9-2]